MKVKIEKQEEGNTITLRLVQNEDEVTVVSVDEDGDVDWTIVSFRVEKDLLRLVKHVGIDDDLIATNDNGQIEEVDE